VTIMTQNRRVMHMHQNLWSFLLSKKREQNRRKLYSFT
jgi:hypothetical protein